MYLPNFILLPIFSKNSRSKFLVCFDSDYTLKAGAKITTFSFKNQMKFEVFFRKVSNQNFNPRCFVTPDFLRTFRCVSGCKYKNFNSKSANLFSFIF